jgi:hypothetical protein
MGWRYSKQYTACSSVKFSRVFKQFVKIYFTYICLFKNYFFINTLYQHDWLEGSDKYKVCWSDFGGLEVACWPKFAGSYPAEAVGFLRRKNPQHAFLRGGSKTVGPMS